jgi:hypothetical protein
MSQTASNRADVPGADDDAQTASTYNRLFDAFIDGATAGEHRKLRIVERDDRTLLVAYNKWVYAEREKESGIITLYEAWTDSERVTNASNLQAGRLRQRIGNMSMFNQMMLVNRDEETLVDVDGNEFESFQVSAKPV